MGAEGGGGGGPGGQDPSQTFWGSSKLHKEGKKTCTNAINSGS